MSSRKSSPGRGKKSGGGKSVPLFPVKSIHKLLSKGKKNADSGAALYLNSTLEYVAAEILELSGNAAKENGKSEIDEDCVRKAVENDKELSGLVQKCRGK